MRGAITTASAAQLDKTEVIVAGEVSRIAVSAATDDGAVCFDGGAVQLDALVTMPVTNTLEVGMENSLNQGFTTIGLLAIYNQRLSNAQLQALTA